MTYLRELSVHPQDRGVHWTMRSFLAGARQRTHGQALPGKLQQDRADEALNDIEFLLTLDTPARYKQPHTARRSLLLCSPCRMVAVP